MISKLIKWLAPSMQGNDGKSSARALSNFWFVILSTVTTVATIKLAFVISVQVSPTEHAITALKVLVGLVIINNVTILILFGIVTAQQLTEGIRAFRGQTTIKETTETTSAETTIKTEG